MRERKHEYEDTSTKDSQLSLGADKSHTSNLIPPHLSLMNFQNQTYDLHTPFLEKKKSIGHSAFHVVINICLFPWNKCSGSYYNLGLGSSSSFHEERGLAEWISAFFIFFFSYVCETRSQGNILDVLGACTWEFPKGVCFPYAKRIILTRNNIYTHMYIYIYIYIYVCVCVCEFSWRCG